MSNDPLKEVIRVIRATDVTQPSPEDKKALDTLLREQPAIWRLAGDMVEKTANKLINHYGGHYLVQASLKSAWESLPKELAQPGDGELERLLVQQVVLAWMKLAFIEYQHEHNLTEGSTTIKLADFWERRLNAAQRRYLRATETLGRIRRLNLPAVQINIGEQQVNQINQKESTDRIVEGETIRPR